MSRKKYATLDPQALFFKTEHSFLKQERLKANKYGQIFNPHINPKIHDTEKTVKNSFLLYNGGLFVFKT